MGKWWKNWHDDLELKIKTKLKKKKNSTSIADIVCFSKISLQKSEMFQKNLLLLVYTSEYKVSWFGKSENGLKKNFSAYQDEETLRLIFMGFQNFRKEVENFCKNVQGYFRFLVVKQYLASCHQAVNGLVNLVLSLQIKSHKYKIRYLIFLRVFGE